MRESTRAVTIIINSDMTVIMPTRETVFAYFRSLDLTRALPAINHTVIIKVDYSECRFAVGEKRNRKGRKEGNTCGKSSPLKWNRYLESPTYRRARIPSSIMSAISREHCSERASCPEVI